ncbi:MAG: gamma carbonic anhydrase family protein [Planctomycetales bacterium]|nr:gamma carbonic anhydrase family protein [Planctomycetales bacterium]
MPILPFEGRHPRLDPTVFVVESATVIGDVVLGPDCGVWFGAVVRGDVNFIRIGARVNIQDNCVVHVQHETHPTFLEDDVTVGHGAIVHGCHVKSRVLVGMGARILDGAEIGEDVLVAAGALVKEGFRVPPGTLVAGVPARVVRELRPDEIARLRQSALNYVDYARRYRTGGYAGITPVAGGKAPRRRPAAAAGRRGR